MSSKVDIVSKVAPAATRSERLVTVVAAVVAALAGWLLIESIGGVDLHAPAFNGRSAQDIGAGATVFASLVASLAAWALLAVLERYSSRPRRIWTSLAMTGLVLSLGGPMSGSGIDTANRGLLALLHLIVAAVLIPLLYQTAAVGDSKERT